MKNNNGENEIMDNYEGGGLGMSIDSNGNIFVQIYLEAYEQSKYVTNLQYNEWYTAVSTYDGNTIKLYLNGNLVATNNVSGTIKPSPCPIYLGANPGGVTYNTESLSSFIYSNALLYDRALSEEEITEVFSNTIDKNKVSQDKLLFYYDFK